MKIVEVTADNFASKLPSILSAIDSAHFASFDTELSGLVLAKSSKNCVLDEAQGRYEKVRESASSFCLLQFGLSLFIWNSSKTNYTSETYAFYLFPNRNTKSSNDANFVCQISTISFLTEYNFDFNKAFYKGIPFLSFHDEKKLREGHAKKQENSKEKSMLEPQGNDKVFVEEQCKIVQQWVVKGARGVVELSPCNSFQRLLLYQQLRSRFNDIQISKKNADKGDISSLQITKCTLSEAEKREEDEKDFEKKVKEMIGFRVVIDRLVSRRIPIVGHNCLLDLCHLYAKFIGPLPERWEDFKNFFRNSFPKVVDTKYIASCTNNIRDTGLPELTARIKSISSLPLALDEGDGKEQFHNAGYDSLCTGRALIGLAFLEAKTASVKNVIDSLFNGGNLGTQAASALNKVFVMLSDYPYFRLDINDDVPDRSRVFYFGPPDRRIEGALLPDTLSTNDIIKAAKSLIDTQKTFIEVIWINKASFFIILEDQKHSIFLLKNDAFKNALNISTNNDFTLMPYSKYSESLLNSY